MSNQGPYITAAVTATGVLAGIYCAYKIYSNRKAQLPKKWKRVGTLQELCIYPIKSCGPVFMNEAECSLMGLKDSWLRDRVLMVVDETNSFITARGYPELLLVQPTVKNAVLTLRHKDMEPLHVNLAEVAASDKVETAVVWGDNVPVWNCGAEASQWFTKLINKPGSNYSLVYYASQQCRKIRDKSVFKYYKVTKNDTGAFPDEVSYHLLNQASIDDLNTRMTDCKASARHFRSNFLVSGAFPYDEDNWKFIMIGDNIFEVIKPCTRCLLTTIDPETGVRHSKSQPLETLKTYRQIEDPEVRKAAGHSPRMGLQMALRSAPGGVIRLNDPIFVNDN